MTLEPERNTVELQSLLVVMKALVKGGVVSYSTDEADVRIRIEEESPTKEQHQGIVWTDPLFILHCVEFNKLYDSANYVITPPLLNEKLPNDAISVLKRGVDEDDEEVEVKMEREEVRDDDDSLEIWRKRKRT